MNAKPRPMNPGVKFGLLLITGALPLVPFLYWVVGVDPWPAALLVPVGLLIAWSAVPRTDKEGDDA